MQGERINIGGKFSPIEMIIYDDIYVEKVIYSKKATIVFWSDNTKTVSRCCPNDQYSREAGLAICYLRKLIGNRDLRNFFDNWLVPGTEDAVIKLSDVRRNIKKNSKEIEIEPEFSDTEPIYF